MARARQEKVQNLPLPSQHLHSRFPERRPALASAAPILPLPAPLSPVAPPVPVLVNGFPQLCGHLEFSPSSPPQTRPGGAFRFMRTPHVTGRSDLIQRVGTVCSLCPEATGKDGAVSQPQACQGTLSSWERSRVVGAAGAAYIHVKWFLLGGPLGQLLGAGVRGQRNQS